MTGPCLSRGRGRGFLLLVSAVLLSFLLLFVRPCHAKAVADNELGNTPTVCSTASRCAAFSWSNCRAGFSCSGGTHTKYVYCKSCGGLVLVQEAYGSCLLSSSESYVHGSGNSHEHTTKSYCYGDSKDGTKWGGCGYTGTSTRTESCSFTVSSSGHTQTLSCTKCGYSYTVTEQDDSNPTVSNDTPASPPAQDGSGSGGFSFDYSYSGLTARCICCIEMWHYSGGYWSIGYAGGARTVGDSTVGSLLNIQSYLGSTLGSTNVTLPYPAVVAEAVADGDIKRLNVYVGSVKIISGGAVIATGTGSNDSVTSVKAALGKNALSLSVGFSYHISPYSMSDFVGGLGKDIPIVASAYGSNLYSVFSKAGVKLGYGTGRFEGLGISSPYIHPREIKDSSGAFASGYSILVNGGAVSSDGKYVGWKTFSNAGAVGLEFDFPFTIRFELTDKTAEADGNGDNPGSENPANTTLEPSEPNNPSIPSTPNGPSEPSTPSSPSNPFAPSTPSEPAAPGNPQAPSNPAVPANPNEPDTPSDPEEPGNKPAVTTGAAIHRKR